MGLPMYRLEKNKNVKLIIDGKVVYAVVIRYNDHWGHVFSILWCTLFIYGHLHIYGPKGRMEMEGSRILTLKRDNDIEP